MKKIKHTTVIMMIFCTTACNSYQPYRLDKYYGLTNRIEENRWVTAFKSEVFFSCIEEGYKNDSILLVITPEKLSNPYYTMRQKEILIAKNLGKDANRNAPKRLYFIGYNDTPLKRHIATACLKYYVSRELDSIAKNEYKIYFDEFINNKEWDNVILD